MIAIGRIIRECRNHIKWSIVQLSAESGVAQSAIQEIETGKRDARFSTIETLVTAMGYEIEVLKADS